ncbi:hypothetical protein KI387_010889, partial [Taxus chinensis]
LIHDLEIQKRLGIIIMLDISKAFDMCNWQSSGFWFQSTSDQSDKQMHQHSQHMSEGAGSMINIQSNKSDKKEIPEK